MNPRGGKDQSYHQKAFGRWIGKGGARRATKHATLAPPLGDIFATIQHDDLEDSTDQEHDEIHITSSQYLTSYNWLNRERYLIIVPGEKIDTMNDDCRDPELMSCYKVNRQHGRLFLSRSGFEGTPDNTIVTLTLHGIPFTHLSR